MKIQTKMKLRKVGGDTDILVLVAHPMETGDRVRKKTGKLIPAHYIERLVYELNGRVVAEVDMGPDISKRPLMSITLQGVKSGDWVSAYWVDNHGLTGRVSTIAK